MRELKLQDFTTVIHSLREITSQISWPLSSLLYAIIFPWSPFHPWCSILLKFQVCYHSSKNISRSSLFLTGKMYSLETIIDGVSITKDTVWWCLLLRLCSLLFFSDKNKWTKGKGDDVRSVRVHTLNPGSPTLNLRAKCEPLEKDVGATWDASCIEQCS